MVYQSILTMTKQMKINNKLHEELTKLKDEAGASYGGVIEGLVILYRRIEIEHPEMLE